MCVITYDVLRNRQTRLTHLARPSRPDRQVRGRTPTTLYYNMPCDGWRSLSTLPQQQPPSRPANVICLRTIIWMIDEGAKPLLYTSTTTIIIIGVEPPTRSSSRIHRVSYRISLVPTRRRHHNIQGNIHICEG